MSIVTELTPVVVERRRSEWAHTLAARCTDYIELAKPRIAVMVLITVAVGYLVGQQGPWTWDAAALMKLWHAWIGIAIVAAGSSALNQWWEQKTDARMRRTSNRPLPAGRLFSHEVLMFGLSAALIGSVYLAWQVNLLTAVLTAATFVLYAGVYTPLKRWTSFCTAVGAIPGAMPPVLGWVASGQPLDWTAFALFAVMFFWQFPHFLAIAWLYQDDYANAGLRMLPGVHPARGVTGLMATAYALGLIPISLLPTWWGIAGSAYAAVALLLGIGYLAASIGFAWNESRASARRVLWISLVYLPLLLMMLAGDHVRLLNLPLAR
ncbi:MAG TPA: heme o synthase [Planctomycetaceae bacterium]|nr:heme o synthase [Planctomycetaceae bacterium]